MDRKRLNRKLVLATINLPNPCRRPNDHAMKTSATRHKPLSLALTGTIVHSLEWRPANIERGLGHA